MNIRSLLLVLAVGLFARPTFAAEAPPPDLAQSLSELRGHLADVRTRISAASDAVKAASAEFKLCKNGKLQLQFGSTMRQLEDGRVMLEIARRSAEHRRHELESARTEIESNHRASLKRRGAEAAQAEQNYAYQMTESYVKPFEPGVVAPLEAYASRMSEYASMLQRYSDFCAAPGYTVQAGAALVRELAPKSEAMVTAARGLVPDNWRTQVAHRVRSPGTRTRH